MKNNLLTSIEQQFTQINYVWKLFLQLYDSGNENIDLLNKSGSNFFEIVQSLMIYDTMSALCRLTDPASTGKSKNASISLLLEHFKGDIDDDLLKEYKVIFSEIDEHIENIRITRNKMMSHSDLEHSLKVLPIPKVTYDDIENSISVIRKLLEKITGNSTEYTPHIPYGTDGNKLLSVLAKVHGKG